MAKKILVVDDEKKIRRILCKLLRDEKYSVQSAGSGAEGITLAKSFRPDLILMDQKMPSAQLCTSASSSSPPSLRWSWP